MHILKQLQIQIKDPAKLPDTSRHSILSLVRTQQNPGGRLLVGKTYDVYGITETQARAWAFLLVSETNELVWVDMEFCLFAEATPAPAPAPAPVVEEPQTVEPAPKRGRKPAPVDPTLEAAPF